MLQVSASPHIRAKVTTTSIMRDVLIALLPALVWGIYVFGYSAAILTAVCVASTVTFEYLSRLVMKRSNTISDLSAAVTGVLLAFNLPPNLPIWIAVLGSFIAIAIVKQMFGGVGDNFANPAIAARIILMVSFPAQMTRFMIRGSIVGGAADLVSQATPLAVAREAGVYSTDYLGLFLGNKAGTIGEVSILALLIGVAYLVFRHIIDLWIPLSFILTTALLRMAVGGNAIFEICTGGLILGAFFMATDYVTSPSTTKGKLMFGIGCGLMTFLIRTWGSTAEGVSYAILLMNLLVPYFNNWSVPKTIGGVYDKK